VDYHFYPREDIQKLSDHPDFVVMDVRGDLQALDLKTLGSDLRSGDVFFEGNPFVGALLLTSDRITGIERKSVFMAPLCSEEIRFFTDKEQRTDLEALLTDIMRRKLLRRTRKQKQELSLKDLENIEKRASSAYAELRLACQFDWVIPNHDGEDSEHWDAFYYPIGSARMALETFVAIVTGQGSGHAEKWGQDLMG
jgi:guanylate kinase